MCPIILDKASDDEVNGHEAARNLFNGTTAVATLAPVAKMITIDAGKCTWDNKTKTLTGEASDFNMNGFPKTINVHNPKTGKTQEFRFVEEEWTGCGIDNDMASVRYAAKVNSVWITLRILND